MLAQYTESGKGILGSGIELGGLFNNAKIDVDSYKKIIDDFKKIGDFSKYWEKDKFNWDAIADAIEGCDETALSYFKTLDDGNGTINNQSASVKGLSEHLQATGQSFGFASIKATLFNTVLNAGIFLVASLAIQGIAKALDNYIHRVDNARERTAELFDEFKEMHNTLADHKKTVAELADRYDELSKGVNLSTNENISLSTEEYEEFLSINEQLANSFPELAKGIDENGNSILTLGTKGITAKEQLEELLQTEEDLNNFRIAEGLEDAFKGIYTYIEDANEATDELNGSINDSSEAMSKLQDVAENGIKLSGEYDQLIFTGNTNNQAELDYMNSLTASVNEFWKSLDDNRRVELGIDPSDLFTQKIDETTGVFEVYANAYSLTPEELTALEAIIQDNVGDASGALLDSINAQKQEIQARIQQGENAWADFIPNLVAGMKSKQTFKNLDSDLQDIAVQIVEGLNYSYATAMNEYDPDPYAYIRDKLIVPMSNLSDSDKELLKSSFTDLFKLDAENISKNNQAEISKLIDTISGILEKDPLELRVALGFDVGDDAKRRLENSISHIADRDVDQHAKLNEYTDKLTLSEVELWLEATQGAKNATEAIEMYESALANTDNVVNETPISSSASAFLSKFESQYKPALSAIQSSMNEVMEATENGIELKVDSASAVNAITEVKNAVDEINNNEKIDFNIDTSSVDEFSNKLMSALDAGDLNGVKQAYADFATDVINSMENMFGEIDGSNMKAAQKALESVGILNAEAIIAEKVGYSYQEYEAAKEAAANCGANLNDDLSTTIEYLDQEGLMATEDAQQIVAYMMAKASANGTIDVSGTIAELAKEWEWLQDLIDQWQKYNSVSQKGHGNSSGTKNLGSGSYTPVQTVTQEVEIEAKFDGSKANSAARSAGKSAGKSFEDGLREQLSDLDSVISGITGRIDDQISSVNEQKEAALNSISEQKEAIESAKEAAISALEEERQKRLDVIEAQRKQIEESIKAKQKIIDGIQDEIDAMREANEERQRELDLQKAKYELERMQNQRTKLVKMKMPYITVM